MSEAQISGPDINWSRPVEGLRSAIDSLEAVMAQDLEAGGRYRPLSLGVREIITHVPRPVGATEYTDAATRLQGLIKSHYGSMTANELGILLGGLRHFVSGRDFNTFVDGIKQNSGASDDLDKQAVLQGNNSPVW